jgi:hypothetical protein
VAAVRCREDTIKLPRSAAGWTVAVFGTLAVLLGVVGLVRPETLLAGTLSCPTSSVLLDL